jgi:hypothetical protein
MRHLSAIVRSPSSAEREQDSNAIALCITPVHRLVRPSFSFKFGLQYFNRDAIWIGNDEMNAARLKCFYRPRSVFDRPFICSTKVGDL